MKEAEAEKEAKEAKAVNVNGEERSNIQEGQPDAGVEKSVSVEGGAEEKIEAEIKIDTKVEEDFKSKYLYLAAELENQKRRFQKERENIFKFGSEKILSDLIEVVDNLERTVAAINKNEDEKIKNIVKGIDMVRKQLLDTLDRHGLTHLESLGKDFDPSIHEAVAQEESDQESNKIISVFERGYKLNGRLLRAAKVVVAK